MRIQDSTKFILLLLTMFCVSCATAKPIDCMRAKNKVDSIICSQPTLQASDHELNQIFTKLMHYAPTAEKSKIRDDQKHWLKSRDTCNDEACVKQSYAARLSTLTAVATQVMRHVNGYKVDHEDMIALNQVKLVIEKQLKRDAELPLETALTEFKVGETTTFSNTVPDQKIKEYDVVAQFPKKRPKGVSLDEWQALTLSKIEGGGENGVARYTLVDLDHDGNRDLIIDSYTGGTGLFSNISVLKRKGNRFVGYYASVKNNPSASDLAENESIDGELYSLNGRGSNQMATWIKVQERIYVAYRNSTYGEDQIFLLRPFVNNVIVPVITVNYNYKFTIPKLQRKKFDTQEDPYLLDDASYLALSTKLKQFSETSNNTEKLCNESGCPVPVGVSEDDKLDYSSYPIGHYSFEIIGNFPVWIKQTCYLGQLVDWFGNYDKVNGLYTILNLHQPGKPENTEKELSVVGRRSFLQIKSGLQEFPP